MVSRISRGRTGIDCILTEQRAISELGLSDKTSVIIIYVGGSPRGIYLASTELSVRMLLFRLNVQIHGTSLPESNRGGWTIYCSHHARA